LFSAPATVLTVTASL